MGQKFRELVQEQLNVGVNRKWVENPGGGKLRATQIGIHTLARGQKAYTATWSPGAIADGAEAATTLTVPDATTGDVVIASHDKILTSDLKITGHVSSAGTVTAVIVNKTGASVTPASGTLRVLVFDVSGQTSAICEDAAPTAAFSWANTVGTTIAFTDESTGTVDDYLWDFDGLDTSTDQNPSYDFGDFDPHTVTLTVSNCGGSDDAQDTVQATGS